VEYLVLSKSYHPPFTLIKAIGYMAVLSSLLYFTNSPALPVTCTSVATGMWSASATWDCGNVPGTSDDAVIAENHIITVDTNATPNSVTVELGGILTMSDLNTLTINRTTFGYGIEVRRGGTFNAGAGAINVTGKLDGLENSGTFVGGTGAINVTSLEINHSAALLTVGSGGIATTHILGEFYPMTGRVILNGNLTVNYDIVPGEATFSGAGKIILTDADHTIGGPVNVHNLETAAFTAPRTITIDRAVSATGTTKLNGVSGHPIVFAGASTPTFTAFTSYYCLSNGGMTNITCNASAPPSPVSASINLMSNEKPVIFAEEVEMK